MNLLISLLSLLLLAIPAWADESIELEEQAGRSEVARTFASAFLVQYAPDLMEAMANLEGKIKELTTTSGDLFLSRKDQKLFIETTDPESKIVADLRKQKNGPLVRWEARGSFDYVKGGLELNLTQEFGPATKVALRGVVSQEFFEPLDPKYEITAKLVHRF